MSKALKSRLHENKTGTRYWALDSGRMSLLSKEVVASTYAKIHFAKERGRKNLSEAIRT